ncbi:MAG: methylated-DNA--[protein]-cysteine S-methyltransferase [Eubacteriales bacterium]|nr:methylated-DNA--[protein]-cysteine S-methyltransferase [Eubacteriales bacterium]
MIYKTHYNSPVGRILLAEKNDTLIGLWLEGQKYFSGTLEEEPVQRDDSPVFRQTKGWLDRYFAGEKPLISELNISPPGSEFRRQVWKLLCEIPYGKVTTYGEISKKIAVQRGLKQMSAQAVGGAVGHNPISIIIPCHRVLGADGSLTGYAGGIQKKIMLLKHEGVDMSRLFVPHKGSAL